MVGLAMLSVRYAGVEGPGWLDTHIDAIIRDSLSPYQTSLRRFVGIAGPLAVITVSTVIILADLALLRGRLAVVALVGPALTGLVTMTLQPAIGRTLDGDYALPSGHTAGATAAATVTALFAVSLAGRRLRLVGLLGATGVLLVGAAMGVALVVNGLHFITDTVAGFCTAVAVVLGTAVAVDFAASRGARHP
jgi:undecaprenyl-diphosphatase